MSLSEAATYNISGRALYSLRQGEFWLKTILDRSLFGSLTLMLGSYLNKSKET
jgi:hypothetical protein